MIRVLHIIGSMNMGGAEMILMNLYRNIDRNKIQFDFVVHTDEPCLYENEIMSLGGNVYHFKKYNGLNSKIYKEQWKNFYEIHDESKIVHCHIGSCASLCLKIAKKYGKITIAHSHNVRKKMDFSLHNFLWSIFSYPTRFNADYFLGCSYEAGKDRYGRKIANSERFQVLNNGIDSKLFKYSESHRAEIRNELGIGNSVAVIGHIGRFVEQKNHKFLIDVFYQFIRSHNDAYLILVGDGKLISSMKAKVGELDLTNKVFFVGTRKDSFKFLSAFDYFVFPSINEGLGISVIEAQASGLPVLCSDVLPPEAKVSSNIEYFSLKEDAKSWADKIGELQFIANREEAYLDISKYNYDISNSVNQLTCFYKKILRKNNNEII